LEELGLKSFNLEFESLCRKASRQVTDESVFQQGCFWAETKA